MAAPSLGKLFLGSPWASPNRRLPTLRQRLEIQASGSTFGSHFRVTIFGESYGEKTAGCVIDGCPPRLPLSEADIQLDLDRNCRRFGRTRITTPHKCKISSGIADGVTTGAPILIQVPNTDQSSTEETSGRVAAGTVPKKILKQYAGTEILAYVSQVHEVILPQDLVDYDTVTLDQIESNIVRCPNSAYAKKMIDAIDAVRLRGDCVGGVVTCLVRNVPRGLGSPVFDKLEAELSKVVTSLPAAIAFVIGSGFSGTFMTGSEHNDEFYIDDSNRIRTKTNRSGGIQGGISNGETIDMRIAFEPTASIYRRQNTTSKDTHEMELVAQGCDDPCVFPRLVPAVEAMVAMVMLDQLMAHHAQCMLFPINPELQDPL